MFASVIRWTKRVTAGLLTGAVCAFGAGAAPAQKASLGTVGEAEFLHPPLSARPGAFWPWLNGHVSRERITYELEQMKEKGMSGADIWDVRAYADPAHMIPAGPAFLGEESLDAIAHTLREADRLGLRMGMIAASGWNAGGAWVEPEDAGMGLFHSELAIKGPVSLAQNLSFPKVPAGCPKDAAGLPIYWRQVAVLAVPYQNGNHAAPSAQAVIDISGHLDAAGKLTWNAPAGDWMILRFIEANTGHQLIVPSPNSGGPMIDFLSSDATRNHFNHILERLESKVGSLNHSALKYLEVDSMELGKETPWTGRIQQEFRKQHGYDPLPYLPVLLGWTVGGDDLSQRFLYDWRKTISDVFIDSHYRTGRKLLNGHGLQLCAEAGGPGAPIWDSCPVDSLKALGSVDIMRGEFWPKHRNMWLVKEIASAAHGYGRTIVDAESFTSWRHWQDGPYFLKQLADRALGEGLNHFTFHTFTHSPFEAGLPGFAYHAGTHINPNIVWWPMARPFIDYLARCSHLLQQGQFVADVCYYYGDNAPNFVPSKHTKFSPGTGFDYDVVNSEIILQRMSVKKGRLVLPDGMSYGMLVLPQREDMDLAVLQKIKALIRAGATVVGPKPTRTGTLADYPARDGRVVKLANSIWGRCDGLKVRENRLGKGRILWNVEVADILKSQGTIQDFAYQGMDQRTRLDYLHRRVGVEDIYFVSNMNERWESVECTFRVNGRQPELWQPETGTVRDLPVYQQSASSTRVPLHLAPAESVFIVFRKPAAKVHFVKLTTAGPGPRGITPALMSHSATPGGPMWLSDGAQPASEQFIGFDLGAEQTLSKVRIWNYDENVRGYINYGVKTMDVLVSPDNKTFRKSKSLTLKDAGETEDKNYSQDFPLQETGVRYLRFNIGSNQSRPNYLEGVSQRAGLSKVKFYDSLGQEIPNVRIAAVSSGVAFDPATDGQLGKLHPAAEVLPGKNGGVVRAWESGTFRLDKSIGAPALVSVPPVPSPRNIEGAWQVDFPKGWAPETNTFEHLVSWTERPEEDIKYFSGIATYSKVFDLPEASCAEELCLELDLGVVQQVAEVTLNGKRLKTLWKPPYTVDISTAVKPGNNQLVIKVANTWNNRLVGDGGKEKRRTRTNLEDRFSRGKTPLQPSGLLGPVRILCAKDIPIKISD